MEKLMREKQIIFDAFDHGPFPESDKVAFLDLYNDAEIVTQVNADTIILKNSDWYLISSNNSAQGGIKISQTSLLSNNYNHVDLIYILPEFRQTKAIFNLIYYVKELLTGPTLADGAIFKDGGKLLKAMSRSSLARVGIIDKTTGEILPFTDTINDPEKCYIFESTGLGFGKQLFLGETNYTWFPKFEDLI
jgi:hypothetical protein